jgi:hypothetical protein
MVHGQILNRSLDAFNRIVTIFTSKTVNLGFELTILHSDQVLTNWNIIKKTVKLICG